MARTRAAWWVLIAMPVLGAEPILDLGLRCRSLGSLPLGRAGWIHGGAPPPGLSQNKRSSLMYTIVDPFAVR